MKTMKLFDEVKRGGSTAVKHFSTGDVTCPVIALLGSYSSGKTTFAISMACDSAVSVLQRFTSMYLQSSMKTEKLYVFTGRDTDRMEVRIKLRNKEILIDTLYNLVMDGIHEQVSRSGVNEIKWHPERYSNISTYVPAKYDYFFYFFEVVNHYHDPFDAQDIEQAAQGCRNRDSDQFLAAFIPLIKDRLYKYIEIGVENVYTRFSDIYGGPVNDNVITVDIDLNNPDKEMVDFQFLRSEDMKNSFEAICDFITMYVPMNEQVKACISNNPVYRDVDGEVSFAFWGTDGICDVLQEGDVLRFLSLLNSKYDAVAFVVPVSLGYCGEISFRNIVKDLEDFKELAKKNGSDSNSLPISFLYNKGNCVINLGAGIDNIGLDSNPQDSILKQMINDMWDEAGFGITADSYPCFVYYVDKFCKGTSDFGQDKSKYVFTNVAKDFLASVSERIKR